jgi:NAD kinase
MTVALHTPRVVLVTRRTEYEGLLARHATREQARFFLTTRGQSIDEVEARHAVLESSRNRVAAAIPTDWRRGAVDRDDLDRFLFEPDDLVVVLGQDGLVANVAKYLSGQPVLGLNPEPDRNPGVLVRHAPEAVEDLLHDLAAERAKLEERSMVEARLEAGPRLLALNEIFVGHPTHQSARYRLRVGGELERQSSSGLIVSTGTGATGWASSIHREREAALRLPRPADARLAWFAREAWPSVGTGTELTAGLLAADDTLELVSEMERGVVFGDGIESDCLPLGWGQPVTIGRADETLLLAL